MTTHSIRLRWTALAATVVAVASLTGLGVGVTAPAAASGYPAATVSDPPSVGVHNHPLWDSYYDLAPFGYEEQEYFVSGTATSDNGATTAPYKTRIIVFRPTAAAGDGPAFNGTVMLDWTNVTAQFENAVDTMTAREMLMREGFTYVHVSAQTAGICCTPLTPKVWDPVRYAALNHPGDQYSNDMLTQVAQAFRANSALVGGQSVTHVLAVGQSQSGGKLNAYATSWLPARPQAAGVIDGVIVHGSSSSGAAKAALAAAPESLKVVHLLSDAEAVNDGFVPDDGDTNYRLWEVAGTAHSDYFIGYQSVIGLGPRTVADAPQVDEAGYREIVRAAGNYGAELHPMLATCVVAGATMPMRYAASAVLSQLDDWVKGGAAPKNGPRFAFSGNQLAKDAFGNTLGGIRMPPIDVPVAEYRSTQCPLGGVTVPFDTARLLSLYPTFDGYRALMQARTDAAVAGGWLLAEDAVDMMARVDAASIRWLT